MGVVRTAMKPKNDEIVRFFRFSCRKKWMIWKKKHGSFLFFSSMAMCKDFVHHHHPILIWFFGVPVMWGVQASKILKSPSFSDFHAPADKRDFQTARCTKNISAMCRSSSLARVAQFWDDGTGPSHPPFDEKPMLPQLFLERLWWCCFFAGT